MSRFVRICLIIAISAAALPAAEVGKIDFTEESLANGLRVVYAPRHEWPVVSVRVVYHVGSKDEPANRQGLAHLVEHMMFRGSAHVGPQEHSRLVTRAGGSFNADTSPDETEYHQTLPANELELALWLEADRMASFAPTQSILAVERNVVRQEWATRQNLLFGWVVDDFFPAQFAGSCYRWPVIGRMGQLRKVQAADLVEFCRKWYVPANATLMISGDFDEAAARRMVRRYFAWIPPGQPAAHAVVDAAAEMDSTASHGPRIIEINRDVPAPMLIIGVATPAGMADETGVRILRWVLEGRLYYYLVNTPRPLAMAVQVKLLRMEEAQGMSVIAVLAHGVTFDQLSDGIFAQLKVIYNEVTQHQIDEGSGLERVSALANRQKCEGIARELAESFLQGEAEDEELAAMARWEIDGFGKLGLRYFDPPRSVTLRVIPQATTRPAAGEQVQDDPAPSTQSAARSVQFPADFPDHAPPPAAPIQKTPVQFEEQIDGVKVVVMPDESTPLVHWAVSMRHAESDTPPGKEGVSELTAAMLGARVHRQIGDPRPKKDELVLAGVEFAVRGHATTTVLQAAAVKEKVADGIEFTRRLLRDPDMLQPDLRDEPLIRAKRGLESAVELRDAEPQRMAQKELYAAVKGYRPRTPTTRSIEGLTIQDARAFHSCAYGTRDATMIISGDVTRESAEKMAHAVIDGWKPQPTEPSTKQSQTRPGAAGMQIVVIDRPGAVQCAVKLAAAAYDLGSEQRFAGRIASQILEAGHHSRLGQFVRAEHGYVYAVGAHFRPLGHGGLFLASCDTEPQLVAATLTEMLRQLERMRNEDVSEEELAEAKHALAAGEVVENEGAMQRLQRRLAREVAMGLGHDDQGESDDARADAYDPRLQDVTAAEIRAVMRDYVRPEKLTVVVVGPAQVVADPLRHIAPVRVLRLDSINHEIH